MNYAEGHGGPIACTAQEINSDLDLYSHAVHVCICVCVCERERERARERERKNIPIIPHFRICKDVVDKQV